MAAKLKVKASFTPDVLGDLWQWERRKRAPVHNRKPISYQAVSVWIFFLVVIKILPLTCQGYMISMWGRSEQSFPPLLAPEAASVFSNNGILAAVYSNYGTSSPTGSMSGKLDNDLATIIAMGCTSEKVLYCIMHDYLEVQLLVGLLHSPRQRKAIQVAPPPLCPWTWVGKSWKFPCLQKKSYQNLPPTITYATALITQFCH